MAYADYQFYINEYNQSQNGSVPIDEFDRLAERSSGYLDYITLGRSKDFQDTHTLQMACCAVVETLFLHENGGGIASEMVGNYSVSYVAGISNTKSKEQQLRLAAKYYLAGTGLLYRG